MFESTSRNITLNKIINQLNIAIQLQDNYLCIYLFIYNIKYENSYIFDFNR